jgi:hypothetical protein
MPLRAVENGLVWRLLPCTEASASYDGFCGRSLTRKQSHEKAAKLRTSDLVVGEKTANPPVVRLLLAAGLQGRPSGQ